MPHAAIVLAAGGSRRLGQPKQLLVCEGETLLNRAIRLAFESGALPVLAVLGAEFPKILSSIHATGAIPVHNDRWRQGMGGSIEEGMRALAVCAPDSQGVLLMGCDQPRLTANHLRSLVSAFTSADLTSIAASSYGNVQGVPAIFPRHSFASLRALRGDRGARSVIASAPSQVILIPFEGGEVDIDSPQDLAELA